MFSGGGDRGSGTIPRNLGPNRSTQFDHTMHSLRLPLLLLAVLLGTFAWADEPVLTLATPAPVKAPGDPAVVDLLILNPSASELRYTPPAEIPGRLVAGSMSRPVVLRQSAGGNVGTVPAGSFARVRYEVVLPDDATQRWILELDQPAALRAVIDRSPGAAVATAAAAEGAKPPVHAAGDGRPGLVPRAAASHIERTFREHFEPHEPVYFIYGPDHPGAKFQLSFKYRILGDSTADEPATTRNSLQFGYTQRSLWDITANSSPFVDTSYMPEIFYEHLAPENEGDPTPFTWLGFQTGYQHESNGKDGMNSRSLNTIFLRPALALGNLGGWRMIFAPRIYSYILDMSDNSDLNKYRGYAEAALVFGRNDGPELTLKGRLGTGWDHATYEVDLTYPLRFHSGGFATYLLIQYFNGYGESLIHYSERSEVLRAGFSFVR